MSASTIESTSLLLLYALAVFALAAFIVHKLFKLFYFLFPPEKCANETPEMKKKIAAEVRYNEMAKKIADLAGNEQTPIGLLFDLLPDCGVIDMEYGLTHEPPLPRLLTVKLEEILSSRCRPIKT